MSKNHRTPPGYVRLHICTGNDSVPRLVSAKVREATLPMIRVDYTGSETNTNVSVWEAKDEVE